MCGVYKIINRSNGKIYIGSSKNIKKRWTRHKSCLKHGSHHCAYLQRAYDKTPSEFSLEIIEETTDLFSREEYWINILKPEYNVGSVGGGDNLTKNPNREDIINRITNTLLEQIGRMSPEERDAKWAKYGEDNPNWKGGISSTIKKCAVCGTSISKRATLCMTCSKNGDNNPFFGKTHSTEFKEKMSKQKIGKLNTTQNKRVRVDGIEYRSMSDAAKSLGISSALMTYRFKKNYPNYEWMDDSSDTHC